MIEPSHAFRLANDPALVSLPFEARDVLTPELGDVTQALRAQYAEMETANAARLAGVEELLTTYGLPVPPRPTSSDTARAWVMTITRTVVDWIDKRSADGRAVVLGYRFGELAVALELAAIGRALLVVAPADAHVVEEAARLEGRLARARAECAEVVSRDEPAARFLRGLVDAIPDAGVAPLREASERLAQALAELGRETASPGRVATLEASPLDTFHLGFLPWSVSIPFHGSALLTAAEEADPRGGLAKIAKLQGAAFAAAMAGTAASIQVVQLLLGKHGLVAPPPPAAGPDCDRWRAAVAAALYDAVCASTPGGAAARLAANLGELYHALTLGLLVSLLRAAAPGSSDLVGRARTLAAAVRKLLPKLDVAVAHPRLGETARAVALDAAQAIRRAPALDGDEPAQARIAALQETVTFLTETRERLPAALT